MPNKIVEMTGPSPLLSTQLYLLVNYLKVSEHKLAQFKIVLKTWHNIGPLKNQQFIYTL